MHCKLQITFIMRPECLKAPWRSISHVCVMSCLLSVVFDRFRHRHEIWVQLKCTILNLQSLRFHKFFAMLDLGRQKLKHQNNHNVLTGFHSSLLFLFRVLKSSYCCFFVSHWLRSQEAPSHASNHPNKKSVLCSLWSQSISRVTL